MIKILYKVFKDFLNKIRKAYILRKYNELKIAEYFRKQGAVVGKGNRIMIRTLGALPFLRGCNLKLTMEEDGYFQKEYPLFRDLGN